MSQYDVVIIGADPSGYAAAIRVTQLGFKTACVDADVNKAGDAPVPSGTYLDVGCILSRALLQSSEHFRAAQHDSAEHGISVGDIRLDAAKMTARKDVIVTKLTSGVKFLFQKDKVTSLFGTASFTGKNGDAYQIEVDSKDKRAVVGAKHAVVAIDSVSHPLPQIVIGNVNALNNEDALNLTKVLAELGVIGSGVIDLEIGPMWNRVGSQITTLEAASTLPAATDQQIVKEVFKCFTEEQGLDIELGVKIGDVKSEVKGASIVYQTVAGEAKIEVLDKLIVAIGRIPNTKGLNAETVGLEKDERSFIKMDGECRTNLPNVWAVGDVVRGPMLTHKASDEDVAIAEHIAGRKPHIDLNNIPFVIYIDPEIAWVGKIEEQFEVESVGYKKGIPGFGANGCALVMGKVKGTVKVLVDARTDRILGIYMIGSVANELITEGATALEFFVSSEDIARIIHAYLTLSGVVHKAALAVDKRALYG